MAEGDVVRFGTPPAPQPEETSWLGDTGRTVWTGVLDATAGVLGLGEYTLDDERSDWFERNRKSLQETAKQIRSRIAPHRQEMMRSQWFAGEGEPSVFDWKNGRDPVSAAYYKLLNMAGSTIPSIVGALAGGLPGAVVGAAVESGGTTGDIYTDLKDKIYSASQADLMKAPFYADAIASGYSDAEARQLLVKDVGKTALLGGAAGWLLGAIGLKGGGTTARHILGREVSEQGGRIGARTVAGALPEGAQEVGQQTGDLIARTIGAGQTGTEPPSARDWANQLADSLFGGTALGGAAGATFGRRQPGTTTVPGKAPDPAQTTALTTQATPPAPPPVVDPGLTGPGIDDIPTGAPGLGAPDYPTQGWTAREPAGPGLDDIPTGAPGLGAPTSGVPERVGQPGSFAPVEGTPWGTTAPVPPGAPVPPASVPPYAGPSMQPVPQPPVPPYGVPVQRGAVPVDQQPETLQTQIQQAQQAVQQLPAQVQTQLRALAENMRLAATPVERERIARQIADTLGQLGVPGPWLRALPSPQGQPYSLSGASPQERLQQAGREMVQVGPEGPGPAPMAGVPVQPRPPVQPPSTVPTGGGAGPAITRPAIPSVTPAKIPTPAIDKARTTATSPQEGAQALVEAFAMTGQNQLAGTTAMTLKPDGVTDMVARIVSHAMTTSKGKPLAVSQWISSIQAVAGEIGNQQIGVDRQGQPVRMRDLLLGMAENLQGGQVRNEFERTPTTMSTQTFDRFGKVTQQGRAEEPAARPRSKREEKFVEKTTQASNRGLLAAATAYARSDPTRRNNVVKIIRNFTAALHRSTLQLDDQLEQEYTEKNSAAMRAEKGGAGVTAQQLAEDADQAKRELAVVRRFTNRLGEIQLRLSGLRGAEGTEQFRAQTIHSALRELLAVTKELAPSAARQLERTLRGGVRRFDDTGDVLDRVTAAMDRSLQQGGEGLVKPEAVRELKPEVVAVKPTGTVEKGGEGRGVRPRGMAQPVAVPQTGERGSYDPTKVRQVQASQEKMQQAVGSARPMVPPPAPPKKDLPRPAADVVKEREAKQQANREKIKAALAKKKAAPAEKPSPTPEPTRAANEEARRTQQEHRALTQVQALPRENLAAVIEAVRTGDKQRTVDMLQGLGFSDPEIAADMLREMYDAQVTAAAESARPPQGGAGTVAVRKPPEKPAGGASPAAPGPRRGGPKPAGPAGQQRGGTGRQAAQQREAAGREQPGGVEQPVRVGAKPALLKLNADLLPATQVQPRVSQWTELDDTGQEGVQRMLDAFDKNLAEFALGDGTGVGKSRQEIVVAVEIARRTGLPSLIVTENAKIVSNMRKEMDALGVPANERPELATYKDLQMGKVEPKARGVIVFDESHNLKNEQAQKTAAARRQPARFTVRASGTLWDGIVPASNTLAQLTGRNVSDVTRELGFEIKTKYTKTGEIKQQWLEFDKGVTHADVLRKISEARDSLVKAGALVRREFPYWGKTDYAASPAPAGALDTERSIEAYWDERYEQAENPGERAAASVGKTRERRAWAELSKVEDAKARIATAIKAGKSVLVVGENVNPVKFQSNPELNRDSAMEQLSAWATAQGIEHGKIYGESAAQKGADADRFKNNEVKLAFMTALSGGTGIELDDQQGGHPRLMIMLTQPYAGDKFEQTLGRISRRRTMTASEVQILQTPGSSADAHGMKVLAPKLTAVHAAQTGSDPSASKLEADLQRQQDAADRYRNIRERTDNAPGWTEIETGPEGTTEPDADNYIHQLLENNARTNLIDVLGDVAERIADPGLRALALRLQSSVPDIPVLTEVGQKYSGQFSWNRGAYATVQPGAVRLNRDHPDITTTLLHEGVHAATVRALDAAIRNRDPMALGFARLFQQLRPAMQGHEHYFVRYAAKNPREFLAVGLTEPAVQNWLASQNVPSHLAPLLRGEGRVMTAWRAFVDWVRQLLRLPPSTMTALQGVLRAGTSLMERERRSNQMGEIEDHEIHTVINDVEQNRTHVDNLLRRSGNPAPRTATTIAGLLDDQKGGGNVASRLMAGARSLKASTFSGVLGASSTDTIVELNKALVPGLTTHQQLIEKRTARISRLMDDKIPQLGGDQYPTHYKGKGLTARGLNDVWMDLASKDPGTAKVFDQLLTVSTEQQVHLDRPRTDIQKDADPLTGRAAMWDRFHDQFEKLGEDWKALYPAVREFYQSAQKLSRTTLLDRLKQDIQDGSPGLDLNKVDFDNLKSVAAATKAGLLSARHEQRVRAIHGEFGRMSFYVPLRRRGDYVVRADFDVDGIFDRAEAELIRQTFPDRRLQWTARPDGKIELRIRPSDAPDATDPTVTPGGPAGRGNPIPLYERFESRAQAEERLRQLKALSARYTGRSDVDISLEVRDSVERLKRSPDGTYQSNDPVISRTAQAELARRVDDIVPERDKARMKRIIMETTAGMLPDTYVAKHKIRRRFIAGASQDQLRALGEYITAFSHNVAHMEHDRGIEDHFAQMEKGIADATQYTKGGERERAQLIMRELKLKEDMQLSRANVSSWVQLVTGTTYFYMLTSASYSMIQFLQPFMVGMPVLGAQYGYFRSGQEMQRAIRMFTAGTLAQGVVRTLKAGAAPLARLAGKDVTTANIFDFEPLLDAALKGQPDEARLKAGLHFARDVGALDLSQMREIYETRSLPSAHRGERDLKQRAARFGQYMMDWSRMMPHAVEVQNRALMFTAAYRLDYERHHDHDRAVTAGVDAIRKSQIDYSAANKARFLQGKQWGGILRIPLMFKQYALHMYALFGMNAMKAFSGDREQRKEGLKALAGFMTTHAMAAGAAGIMLEPIKIALFAVAMAFTGGDGEDEWDVDRAMHEGLRDIFGETWGEAAYGGLPRLLGADISGRVGLQSLLLFNTLDDIERGKSWYEMAGALLTGPSGSLFFKQMPDAWKSFAVGDIEKGVQAFLPKFAKDVVKAYQLDQEGLMDTHGNRIDRTLDVSTAMLAAQALGFRPSEIANIYEGREAIIGAKQALENKSAQLMERYWRSRGDADERYDVMQDIWRFNRANPQSRITTERLQQSMTERRRRERESGDFGVYLSPTQRYLDRRADYLR